MKTFFCLLACLLTANLGVWAEAQIGKPAPAFAAKDINGKAHRLSEYQGKIVVLEAYNLDCPYCANHYKTGAMQELQADLTAKGVIWLLVNSTNPKNPSYRAPAAAQKECAQQKIKASAWIEDGAGEIGKSYGMKTTPHLFVIDKAGILVYEGAIDDRPADSGDPRQARNYVREAVARSMTGEKVVVTSTKPYGCGVKY
ncbi:MAG: redoxin domain-containing protein [Chloroflexi bacterium]|nr:redoxin domain-containing protein [Chloroflexota bacterium]